MQWTPISRGGRLTVVADARRQKNCCGAARLPDLKAATVLAGGNGVKRALPGASEKDLPGGIDRHRHRGLKLEIQKIATGIECDL
jgi:hypothetical protein